MDDGTSCPESDGTSRPESDGASSSTETDGAVVTHRPTAREVMVTSLQLPDISSWLTERSEYQTSLVFKWLKVVRSQNGPLF